MLSWGDLSLHSSGLFPAIWYDRLEKRYELVIQVASQIQINTKGHSKNGILDVQLVI